MQGNVVYYAGGTAFVYAAHKLGYLLDAGDYFIPGIAQVPVEDAKPFEELLREASIPFSQSGPVR